MSVVTITTADVDLSKGTYTISFDVTDSLIDDGQMTAACVTAAYIQSIYHTPEFRADCKRYGDNLIAAVRRDGVTRETTTPAEMYVTLTDMDLNRGSYASDVRGGGGGDPTGNSLPTAAWIVGAYINTLLYDLNFRMKVLAFAETIVRENAGVTIGNRDELPITLNLNDDEAARFAA